MAIDNKQAFIFNAKKIITACFLNHEDDSG